MKKSVNPPKLSLIILNYNSGRYLSDCLQSIYQSKLKTNIEIIVADNASTDNSLNQAQKNKTKHPHISLKFVPLKKNLGFATGNNGGLKHTDPKSPYVLFLNPDTTVNKNTIQKTIDFLDKNPQASALTCKIILKKTGQIQPECHRGFPTPWRSLCYFSGLAKLFPHSKFFAGYFLGHLDKNKTHQIEACVGAFLAVRRTVGQAVGWWNENYFMYGEDIDLCWKLRQKNYRLFYYPHTSITHFQGVSSGIKKTSQDISTATRSTKIKAAKATTEAMRIFYQNNLLPSYPRFTQKLVLTGINLLENIRVFKAKYL
ncbi:glycosyltransferase family 2 protein [Patescibacteria group bacterium]|nr:glycosyltransferase family 2 protein [Patescibacteria group bacterium]